MVCMWCKCGVYVRGNAKSGGSLQETRFTLFPSWYVHQDVVCVNLFHFNYLENLGEDRIGAYRLFVGLLAEFRDYAFDVVVGHLVAKDTNVLQESFDSFDGTDIGRSIALSDHVLFESGGNFLLVAEERKNQERCDVSEMESKEGKFIDLRVLCIVSTYFSTRYCSRASFNRPTAC